MAKIHEIPGMNSWDVHQLAKAVAGCATDFETSSSTIQAAYLLAKAFKDQTDVSNILRRCPKTSLQTAMIAVKEMHLDLAAVTAVILEPPFLDGFITKKNVEQQFGEKTVAILSELENLKSYVAHSNTIRNYPSYPDIHSSHIIAILLHIADVIRMHYSGIVLEEQMSGMSFTSSQLLFILKCFYIPLVHRMQLYDIQKKLADFWLKHVDTLSYHAITEKMGMTKWQRQNPLELIIEEVESALKKQDVDFIMKGRVKSVYSIWNKIQKLKVDFDQIHDLAAIRIIIKGTEGKTIEEEKIACWRVLSLISGLYRPICNVMRDWISVEKENGYESLHLVFETLHYGRLEVQIRTERMDNIAEHGNAAHWKYKCNSVK